MKNNGLARLTAGLLCLCVLAGGAFAPVAALATDENTAQAVDSTAVLEDPSALSGEPGAAQETPVQYVATAAVTIKVRRQPSKDAMGNGSIAEGGLVYVLELGDEWSLVDTGRNLGYVQTRLLKDLRDYSASQGETAVAEAQPQATAAPDTSADTPAGFQEKFKAYAYKSFLMRKEMDDRSSAGYKVSKYQPVTVGAVHGDWCYIRYNNTYGYAPTSALFKWDRIDPFAGEIPGAPNFYGLAFLKHTTDIRSYDDHGAEVLKTVNPGTAVAVYAKDGEGFYAMPYWRTTGYVTEDDVSYVLPVVPWDSAESGDMISCMSTYYAVGVHTLQYQGRNYNIYLGTSLISGTVVQPGETINIYDVMGPYRKSTGYHRAPIWAPDALWGYGGGCCQVNTTLYNALIRAPILINWRKVHADVGIYYCPVGFDAAVGGGDITMIFTNTLPYSIRINFFMTDGCMTVGIFRV